MTLEKEELEFGNAAPTKFQCSHVKSRDQSVAEGLAFFLNFSSSALSRRLLRPDPRLASRLDRDDRLLKERG